jgi:phosphoribosylaminoimidazole-succinocarboxamide synthase
MSAPVVLATDIAGLTPFVRGKVRDVYDLGNRLLIVATDRISVYDSVLPTGIPDKGRVLTQLSRFWFEQLGDVCPTHFIATDAAAIRAAVAEAGAEAPAGVLDGRSMLVRKAAALPIEFVVRGYVEGSAWKEYRQSGSVCGIALPPGLLQADRLPAPIFTPATKATSGHDENITREQALSLGDSDRIQEAIALSLEVYARAHELARERGVLIADTKFEFGVADGRAIMIDECLTPDSSRFWDAAAYRPGGGQYSLDKQFVRDYLDRSGWDHEPPAPPLPDDVVRQTSDRYREIYRRLTGEGLTGEG